MLRSAAVVIAVFTLFAGPVHADSGNAEAVFGQSLMSQEEISDLKAKLANCRSVEERRQVEAAHKDHMIQRARWKGLVLDRADKTVTLADNN
jgi:hypothetical protein